MFERSQCLKGNNKTKAEPASKDERNSARIMNNSSGKTVANSGKVNYKKQYISKVPLRKPNSEAVLKTEDVVNRNSSTSAINISKSNCPITQPNDSNGVNTQKDTEIEFGLLTPQANVSNIENIFYKEAESKHRIGNVHLLVDVIEELRDIKKTLSKSTTSSFFSSMNRSQIVKRLNMDKHIRQRTDDSAEFCGFDVITGIIRPSTAPQCCRTLSDVRLKNRCNSTMKFPLESDFFSKIPIRAHKDTKNKQSNLQIENNDFESVSLTRRVNSFIDEKEKLSLRQKFNMLPIPKRRQSCFGKKYNYRRQRNDLKEHFVPSQSDHELETALSQPPQELRKESLHPTKYKISSKKSRMPKTISSLELNSQIELDKDVKNNDNLQRFASKIPVGVNSNIGINKPSQNELLVANPEKIEKTLKELDELQSNRVSKYQVMAVPNLIYPEVAKILEDKKNKHTDRTKCTYNIKRIEVINDRALGPKRGYPNICKLNPQFCSGDKRKNSKILLRSQSSRRLPRENENKLKLRKPCMPRNVSTSKEFDIKSISSSPDTRTRKFDRKSVKSVKIATEYSPPEVPPIDKSSVHETIKASQCEMKSFSDSNLLQKYNGNCAKMIYSDGRCTNSIRQEKSIQTLNNTNSIEVQANVTLNNTYSEGNTIQLGIKPTDSFGVIWDYCAELIKANQTLEQLLTHYKAEKYFSGIDIGCQVDIFTSIDSYSQTAYCTVNKSCQCCEEPQSISCSLTNLNYNNNLVPNSQVDDVFKKYKKFENIQRQPSICLTLSECSLGLDHSNLRRTMSCYCKELSADDRDKIANKRERNLFDDEYDDDEYSECYMKELLYGDHAVEVNPCGSTPSLPEVVAASDRCESKIEIPWLKISLAPPGYYEIKTMPGRPKQVVCDCWALSTGDDVYTEPVHQEAKPERCKCKNAQGETSPPPPPVKPEDIDKPKPEPRKSQTKEPQTRKSPYRFKKSDDPLQEGELPPEEEEEKEEEEKGENEEKGEIEEKEEEEVPAEEEPPTEEEPHPEEEPPPQEEPPPPEEEELPEGDQPPPEEEQPPPEEKPEKPKPPPEKPPAEAAEDSSSSSIPSTCSCMQKKDECADFLGHPTTFVYENSCYGSHEAYMDPIYKLFPDDCDTYCGPYIEMPWSQLTIPRNIKLRQAKKPTKNDKDCKCEDKVSKDQDKQEEEKEIIVCGTKDEPKDEPNDTSEKAPQYPSENPTEKVDKGFEIQLSFTEILGNIKNTDDATVPSSPGCHCRPPSPRGKTPVPEACPERSNYSCRCSSSKSQRPPSKPRSPKSKNSNCKSAGSSVRIDPTPSYNNNYMPGFRTSSKTPPQSSHIPSKKGHYQDQVMNVLETCEAEMEPLRDTLNQLKSKIRNLNIPELNNWNNGPSSPCSRCPPGAIAMFSGMRPQAPPLPQYPFPQMFPGLSSQLPQMPPKQRPRTCCCAKEKRSRRRCPRSASSSSEFSEFDSLSDGESPCPFLRALSSKSIYKGKDSRTQRKLKARDGNKYERQCKKLATCAAKRNNKKNQVDYSKQDNGTDTEPEIQVHYGPTRPRMKTKQLFKSVIDPNLIAAKNQRLRIAVKVTPSDAEASNDKLLAIQGPYETSKSSHCSGCKRSR